MNEDYRQIDYEEGVIGATFNHWEETREYQAKLKAEDFTDPACMNCWKLFVRTATMDEYLTGLSREKLAVRASGCSDHELAKASLLPWLTEKLRRNGMTRRIRQGVHDIFERDGDLLTEIDTLVSHERQQMETADDKDQPRQLYEAVMNDIMDNDLSRRLYTGINSVDSLLGGLRLGNVSILGAEPSTGKTALALNIAMNALKRGRKVAFFSLEMSDIQLLERMVAATGKISYDSISNKRLSREEQLRFAEIARDMLMQGRLHIFDTLYFVEQMAERIITLKPDLVLVDFLQFCRTGQQANSTADRLEYIVSEFKRIAKLPYCQCHIMLLSQPSRQSGQEKQSMFALKGSSAIEQGGDVIMLLDRPAVRDIQQPPERSTVKIAKNKFGRTGLVDLYFDGDHQRFRDPKGGDVYTRPATAEEVAERPWYDEPKLINAAEAEIKTWENQFLNEKQTPVENSVEPKQATDGMDNIRDIADAVANEEMDVNEGYDEIKDLLNQMDQEREAAGEVVGEAGEKPQLGELNNRPTPEANIVEGRIEVKFPKWPGKNVTKQLRDAGFSWDKYAKIWWGDENDSNRALVEKLTGVELPETGIKSTEDEFKPEVRRIPKDNHGNPDTRFSINNDTAIVEDENVDRMVDAVMQRLQDEGVVDNFNRSDMPEGVEGSQRGKNITVSEKVSGTTRAANAATHEIGHLAARSDPKLVPDVISSMRQMGVDVDGRIEERRATYGEEGLTPPEGVTEQEYIEEEVAMDFLGGISENDVETLNRIAAKEPGLIQRFINGLKKIWGKLTGDQKLLCEACINRLNTALAKANTGSNIDEDESTRYSVGTKPSSTANAPTVPSSTFTPNENGEAPVDRMIPGVEEIWQDLPDSAKNYMIKHLTDINGEAWKNIMKKGGVDAVSGTLLRAKNWTSPQLEMAVEVGKYFADNGETERAADIAAKIAGQQTDFGRAIKYLQTFQMYMPKSAAAITHSIANDLGVELTKEEQANIDLCDRIIEQGFISDSVLNKATGDFKEWLNDAREYMDRGQLDASTAAYAAAMTLVTAKKPATARQKFRSLQRISLLSNPKTHFRNILGNLAEQAGSVMSRPVADLTDRFLSKFTKQRTFGSGGAEAFVKSFTDSVEKAVMDHALEINTVGNKFDEDTAGRKGIEQLKQQRVWDEHTKSEFRNGVARIANNIDRLIGLGLSVGDAPALIGTYNNVLTQLMNANPDLLVNGEPTAEMIDTAWDTAYRRTFRDDNAITKALTSIRNDIPFAGETIAPYVQTPVNVVLTAIQYSPIGFAEAFAKALVGENSMRVKLQNNESTMKVQRQISELVGRGALGTAAMLVGALLASAGRITGDDDDIDSQKEKNWNTATGRKGSSIKIGDTYIDPSSLQSLSTPIMAGAAAYQSGEEEDETGKLIDILAAAAKASMKMGNTMLEMPVLQGVADLFSGNYDNGELLAGALSLAGNAATQVVPFGSLLKQAGKAVDPYSRVQSEINAGPVERVAKSTINNLRSMTPWGREKLSERYDVLGNPIKNDASDNVVERLYNSFINPFNTSKENANEVTDEIDRLYAALQDTDVLPSAAGNSISYGGEKYKFTSAEKQEYQRIEGESNAEILSSLVNSDAYSNLSDEDKAKILSSVYDYSANKAKADYLKKQGVEYESDAKWMDSIDSIVETGVDIGSAMVYRYEIGNIKGSDNQVFYIDSLPLNSDQKDVIDEAFVDQYRPQYIDEDRDYTNADTLALSMTSDSGREKYNIRFANGWRGASGNYYGAMTGEQFGHFYDAYYSASTADERVAAIKRMLMDEYGMDESEAYTLAYDFRKRFASTKN